MSTGQRPLRVFVLDCEALSLAVRGDRKMIAWLDLAARGEAEVVTSPMTLVEAYDGRTTEQRWDWVLSRLEVADIGKDEARRARRLLSDARLHGHKYAIDAMLAVIARPAEGAGHRLHLGRGRPGEAGSGVDRRQESMTRRSGLSPGLIRPRPVPFTIPPTRGSVPGQNNPVPLRTPGRTFGKRVGGNPSRVRISYPPPLLSPGNTSKGPAARCGALRR